MIDPFRYILRERLKLWDAIQDRKDTTRRAHSRFILFRFKRSPSRKKTISAHELPEHRLSEGEDYVWAWLECMSKKAEAAADKVSFIMSDLGGRRGMIEL